MKQRQVEMGRLGNAAVKGSGPTMQPENQNIPKRFPVVLEDKILYWMRNSHCANFGLIAQLNGRLDFVRLKQAMRMCLDAEPILGCRFVETAFGQHWERLPDLNAEEICTLVENPLDEDDPGGYWDSLPDLDVHQGPQARVWVLRGRNDLLCLRVNHVASDGGGVKDLAYLLARTYNRLERDPYYIPPSNIHGARGLAQVFRHMGWRDRLGVLRRTMADAHVFLRGRSKRRAPLDFQPPEGRTLLTRVIAGEDFRRLKAYGKARGATINDTAATAAIRAFYSLLNSDPKAYARMVATADLRRYIPGGQAESVCNLSGFSYINVGRGLPGDYNSLLRIVHDAFQKLKQEYIGMGNIPLSAAVFKTMPFSVGLRFHDGIGDILKKKSASTGDLGLMFTNAGVIDPEKFRFNGAPAAWAGVTATRSTPPVVTVCISGLGDSLLVTLGFCQNVLSRDLAERFLDRLEAELIRTEPATCAPDLIQSLNP
ncbi:protein of unknown function UPF0089 [Desulfatibacillum aliphaticivorans]|uniref:Condensation domain protein n=2 Tax=Desulfatibacillum aliphaticivorans TaxID=218208 RepID=B8FBI4_DESAL|nr:protein of unknown function UPF0089 [Desulfatibacillum aliphaticivorans]